MKPSLQLKMGQQLAMTPQLQQAIRLLQLSTLDLQQEIQETLEANPMLEASDPNEEELAIASDSRASELQDLNEPELGTEQEPQWNEHAIPDDLPVDSAWDDVYQHSSLPSAGTEDSEELNFERNASSETLQEHLRWQLNLTVMSDTDRAIAEAIIDSINPDGYLVSTLEDIHQSLSEAQDIELAEVETVLHRIQQFDPTGVGARDLQECLLLQLAQLPADLPCLAQARKLVEHYLPLLGSRDYTQLMRRLRIKQPELEQVIQLIQSLTPRPGAQIADSQAEYVIPDVIVSKQNGRWLVELNPEAVPKIRINPNYAALVKRADSSQDNTYLRNHLQEARWFLKSLQSRNETLLKVARCITEFQRDFLEHGEEAMKPLVLHDVAEAVEMHESTISRVTTQKYMHTPRGIFELKYFFSSHVGTASGGECSSTAIRAIIKKLIAAEDPKKPLSDSKIASLLAEQGIKVARRTIAKYREALSIPPSNERKKLVS